MGASLKRHSHVQQIQQHATTVKQKRSVVVPHVAATGSASSVPAKRRARVQGEIKGTTATVLSHGNVRPSKGHGCVYPCTCDLFVQNNRS